MAFSLLSLFYFSSDVQKPQRVASIGISFWHGTSDSPESLFKRADDALYRAKGSGRNCLRMEEETAK